MSVTSGDLNFFLSACYKRRGFLKHLVIRRGFFSFFFFFLRFSVAGKFLTLERHPGSSLSSRSYSEALHCHWPLLEKPDPLCFAQSLLEFLRTGAGGEDSSPSRCTDLQAQVPKAGSQARPEVQSEQAQLPWHQRCSPSIFIPPRKNGPGQRPPSTVVWQERPFLDSPVLLPISSPRG